MLACSVMLQASLICSLSSGRFLSAPDTSWFTLCRHLVKKYLIVMTETLLPLNNTDLIETNQVKLAFFLFFSENTWRSLTVHKCAVCQWLGNTALYFYHKCKKIILKHVLYDHMKHFLPKIYLWIVLMEDDLEMPLATYIRHSCFDGHVSFFHSSHFT